MSYTVIYRIDKTGDVTSQSDIKNAWRGAMAIWTIIENKYLPPYFHPSLRKIISRTIIGCMEPELYREIWDLSKGDTISDLDKIVLCSTYDRWIVLKENFNAVIDAFNSFEGETSLKEQAEVIKSLIDDNDCIGIAWNQTSACSGVWDVYDKNEEGEEKGDARPYNIFKESWHTNLFEEISI